MANNNFIL